MNYHVLILRRLLRWDSAPHDGGRYDMSHACRRCGAGAVRIDPLFVVPSRCKNGIAATYKLQVVVSRDVFEALSSAGVTSLRQALNEKTREPVSFWSLDAQASLPRWSVESRQFEIEGQCPDCCRDGYFSIPKKPLALVYDSIPAFDVLATWEHFGNSRLRSPFEQSILAVPHLVVSDRVRDVLANYRGVEFYRVEKKEPNKAD